MSYKICLSFFIIANENGCEETSEYIDGPKFRMNLVEKKAEAKV